jgi:CBS domain-containing protein
VKIKDVMTRDVVTVGPETPLRDVARILVEHRISGLPVVTARRKLLGVVSEADILYKELDATRGRGGFASGTTRRAAAKALATTAGDAMTTPAITVTPLRAVAEAARLMTEHGVNRLPVVRGEELVGIVTRADLVRAFTRADADIDREIREDIVRRVLWLEPGAVGIAVERGNVILSGELAGKSDVLVLERLVRRVPGVVTVRSQLAWKFDDTRRRAAAVDS